MSDAHKEVLPRSHPDYTLPGDSLLKDVADRLVSCGWRPTGAWNKPYRLHVLACCGETRIRVWAGTAERPNVPLRIDLWGVKGWATVFEECSQPHTWPDDLSVALWSVRRTFCDEQLLEPVAVLREWLTNDEEMIDPDTVDAMWAVVHAVHGEGTTDAG